MRSSLLRARSSFIVAHLCLFANLALSVCLFKGIQVPYLFESPDLSAVFVFVLLMGYMFLQKRENADFPSLLEGSLILYFSAALMVYGEIFKEAHLPFHGMKVFNVLLILFTFFGLCIVYLNVFQRMPSVAFIVLLFILVFGAVLFRF